MTKSELKNRLNELPNAEYVLEEDFFKIYNQVKEVFGQDDADSLANWFSKNEKENKRYNPPDKYYNPLIPENAYQMNDDSWEYSEFVEADLN